MNNRKRYSSPGKDTFICIRDSQTGNSPRCRRLGKGALNSNDLTGIQATTKSYRWFILQVWEGKYQSGYWIMEEIDRSEPQR